MLAKKEKKDWLEALRSGKFRQGRGSLVQKKGGHYSYCCLGVYLHTKGWRPEKRWVPMQGVVWVMVNPKDKNDFEETSLPWDLYEKFGEQQDELIHMNDDDNNRLKTIAKYVEKNL